MDKYCYSCNQTKSLSEFHKDKSKKYGVSGSCKECAKQQHREYYARTAALQREKKKQYRIDNPEKEKLAKQKYYKKNKQMFIDSAKEWAKNNPEKRAAIAHRWYNKNQDIRAQYSEQYYYNNKDRLRPIRAKYEQQRRKNDVSYRLACTVRAKTWLAIKHGYKKHPSLDLLGCSIEELKSHLEKQFKPGMRWDNWSVYGWHIDHILPIAYFDLTNEEEQRKCFHYTNLQPLWAKENMRKSNKILKEETK